MKKTIFLLFFILVCVSCSNKYEYSECPKDELYKEHDFQVQSIEPIEKLGTTWFYSKCTKCGLENISTLYYMHKSIKGGIMIIKSPKTHDFTDLCVMYKSEKGLRIERIKKEDLVERPIIYE